MPYLLYPGEDHGFRSQDAIIRSFGAELSFYAQVFGFEPADDIEPLEIQFLGESRSVPTSRTAPIRDMKKGRPSGAPLASLLGSLL